jgi:hypothetical protein
MSVKSYYDLHKLFEFGYRKDDNVMTKLAGISEEVFKKTGFFMTHQPLHSCNNHNEYNTSAFVSCLYTNAVKSLSRILQKMLILF